MPIKRHVIFLLLGILLLAGCGKSEASLPVDEIVEEESPTTSTTAFDPYEVPDVIDVAYINRVLAAHAEIRAAVRHDVNSHREFSEVNQNRIKALYTGDALAFQFKLWTDAAYTTEPNAKTTIVPAVYTVQKVHHIDESCIWVTTSVDDSANKVQSGQLGQVDIVIVRRANDFPLLNSTPWQQKQATAVNHLKAEQTCG